MGKFIVGGVTFLLGALVTLVTFVAGFLTGAYFMDAMKLREEKKNDGRESE